MTPQKNLITLENLVKLTVLCAFFWKLFSFLTDMKQDISLIKQSSIYELKNLQYQINELKDCCDKDKSESRQLVFINKEATLPDKIEEKELN